MAAHCMLAVTSHRAFHAGQSRRKAAENVHDYLRSFLKFSKPLPSRKSLSYLSIKMFNLISLFIKVQINGSCELKLI